MEVFCRIVLTLALVKVIGWILSVIIWLCSYTIPITDCHLRSGDKYAAKVSAVCCLCQGRGPGGFAGPISIPCG